ncbi:MAG: endo alpha-1,4 polygalactosaminidase [Paraburkholderia sp.]|uniref:endo alpha-1,4 polygalactosaminidase n=1 Tax=Burkholderiaceae TaxID=119060 RepID=UPI0020176A92|nr:endo alpha-1,4 polygalactosaminidase [Burkholderia sp. 4M9327F10]
MRSLLSRSILAAAFLVASLLGACGGGGGQASASSSSSNSGNSSSTPASSSAITLSGSTSVPVAAARNLPASAVWAVYYGTAAQTNIDQLASSFNVIVIDADPGTGTPNFTAAQISALKAHGAKVLSYLNVGACETWRTYWTTVPSGFVSCGANQAAQLGQYSGYPNEYWMNVGNADYQNLIVNYVAPRLAATGVDGFMLDNFEIVGHAANAAQGPCNAACQQGGLDLVAQLRTEFPNAPIVLNAAPTSAISGSSGGVSFPMLVDGDFAEQVFLPSLDSSLLQTLQSWKSTEAKLPRSAFFTGSLDYVSSCSDSTDAQGDWNASIAAGLSPSVATSALNQVCWWSFLPAVPAN